jgi:CubicO group peptidase (beta-lactamase class C family)
VNKPLVAIPGREYLYSTFGYNLMGVVLEHALGASFASQAASRVAGPTGMTTLQPDYEWASIPHRAVGYDEDNRREGSNDVSWKLAGGGFISTTEDLARFCAGLMGDKLLTAEEKAVAWKPQTTSLGEETAYGLGFDIWYRDDRLYVQHSGFQEKANTRYRYYPENGLCIVVMSNSAQADTYSLVRAIDDVAQAELLPRR